MPTTEDRQTKALEDMARSQKEMVKIWTALNENFARVAKMLIVGMERVEAEANPTVSDDIQAHLEKDIRDREEQAEFEKSALGTESDEELLTPEEWMNKLRRWWNYESVDNMDEMKLTKVEFLTYMQNTRSTEVTSQIPEHIRNAVD